MGTARTRPAAALGTPRPPSPEHEGGAPARVDRMSGVLVLGLAAVFAAGFAGGEECPLPPDVVFPGARAVPDVPRDLMQGGGAVDWGEAFVRRRPFVVRNAEFASRWNALKHWGDPKYVADRWPKLKVHVTNRDTVQMLSFVQYLIACQSSVSEQLTLLQSFRFGGTFPHRLHLLLIVI